MATFVPTQGVVQHLREAGALRNWGEICRDLAHASVTPALGYETRLRYCGSKYEAFVEPGRYEGADALWIVYLRPRGEVPAIPRQRQVVGHEPKRQRSGHGGAGRRWPTTWKELIARVEAYPHAEVRRGGKHLAVLLRGKTVQTFPATASDHRALLNACQVLKSLGVDVRR